MNLEVEELYDYQKVRQLRHATMMVATVSRPIVVLGGNQSIDALDPNQIGDVGLRRRRGGGGLVLLQPGDLWADWWIPATDLRWSRDVRATSMFVGSWWCDVLRPIVDGDVSIHSGPLEGPTDFRSVCFAGLGPGEVLVNGRKAVGVTQWRVREGAFLSSVVHAGTSNALLELLCQCPPGLREALDHHSLVSLGLLDSPRIIDALRDTSGPWIMSHLTLK